MGRPCDDGNHPCFPVCAGPDGAHCPEDGEGTAWFSSGSRRRSARSGSRRRSGFGVRRDVGGFRALATPKASRGPTTLPGTGIYSTRLVGSTRAENAPARPTNDQRWSAWMRSTPRATRRLFEQDSDVATLQVVGMREARVGARFSARGSAQASADGGPGIGPALMPRR